MNQKPEIDALFLKYFEFVGKNKFRDKATGEEYFVISMKKRESRKTRFDKNWNLHSEKESKDYSINVRIGSKSYTKLKELSLQKNKNLSEIVRELIQGGLKNG